MMCSINSENCMLEQRKKLLRRLSAFLSLKSCCLGGSSNEDKKDILEKGTFCLVKKDSFRFSFLMSKKFRGHKVYKKSKLSLAVTKPLRIQVQFGIRVLFSKTYTTPVTLHSHL